MFITERPREAAAMDRFFSRYSCVCVCSPARSRCRPNDQPAAQSSQERYFVRRRSPQHNIQCVSAHVRLWCHFFATILGEIWQIVRGKVAGGGENGGNVVGFGQSFGGCVGLGKFLLVLSMRLCSMWCKH
jgi:hypothetical protein